jgi:hypothetical protein
MGCLRSQQAVEHQVCFDEQRSNSGHSCVQSLEFELFKIKRRCSEKARLFRRIAKAAFASSRSPIGLSTIEFENSSISYNFFMLLLPFRVQVFSVLSRLSVFSWLSLFLARAKRDEQRLAEQEKE